MYLYVSYDVRLIGFTPLRCGLLDYFSRHNPISFSRGSRGFELVPEEVRLHYKQNGHRRSFVSVMFVSRVTDKGVPTLLVRVTLFSQLNTTQTSNTFQNVSNVEYTPTDQVNCVCRDGCQNLNFNPHEMESLV